MATEHTVQIDSHDMTFTYTGGAYEWVKPCGGIHSEDTVTITIPFKFFKFNGNVYANANT